MYRSLMAVHMYIENIRSSVIHFSGLKMLASEIECMYVLQRPAHCHLISGRSTAIDGTSCICVLQLGYV